MSDDEYRALVEAGPAVVMVPKEDMLKLLDRVKAFQTVPLAPRLMQIDLAAMYIGLSVRQFISEGKAGRMPMPLRLIGTVNLWDRHDLDRWIEDRKAPL
jgi:hypothetical protein